MAKRRRRRTRSIEFYPRFSNLAEPVAPAIFAISALPALSIKVRVTKDRTTWRSLLRRRPAG